MGARLSCGRRARGTHPQIQSDSNIVEHLGVGIAKERPGAATPAEVEDTTVAVEHPGVEVTNVEQEGVGMALCVFCHGVNGSDEDWTTWREFLGKQCPHWNLKTLVSVTPASKPFGQSVSTLADLAAEEILDAVHNVQQGHQPLTLHCIGHSMGGLVLRGALARIFTQEPELRAGVFMTLSSPHLGMQASWGEPLGMWKNLAWLSGWVSAQMPQIALQDDAELPYLAAISDPATEHLAMLQKFRRRFCVTMLSGDPLVSTASGALWPDHEWHNPIVPESQVAGWGFEAFSNHEPPPFQPGEVPRCSSEWTKSADDKCWYPRNVPEGLLSLPWDRLIVKLQLPNWILNPHVFLIGQRQGQASLLEHYFSRQCVGRLVDLLAKSAEPDKDPMLSLMAPCWVTTVNKAPTKQSSTLRESVGKWVVATEEGIGNVKFYAFECEAEARYYFDSLSMFSHVLFNPEGSQEDRAGLNTRALKSIYQAFYPPTYNPNISGQWIIGTEYGIGNVQFYCFDTEEKAKDFFENAFSMRARILFNPDGQEVLRGGYDCLERAHMTIAQTFMQKCEGVTCLPEDRTEVRE